MLVVHVAVRSGTRPRNPQGHRSDSRCIGCTTNGVDVDVDVVAAAAHVADLVVVVVVAAARCCE